MKTTLFLNRFFILTLFLCFFLSVDNVSGQSRKGTDDLVYPTPRPEIPEVRKKAKKKTFSNSLPKKAIPTKVKKDAHKKEKSTFETEGISVKKPPPSQKGKAKGKAEMKKHEKKLKPVTPLASRKASPFKKSEVEGEFVPLQPLESRPKKSGKSGKN